MKKHELEKMKVAELKQLAKSLKVHVGNKNKTQLVDAIERFTNHKNHFLDIDLSKR